MSNVDPTVPVQGSPTTQSVRDNFSTIKTELEAFQSTATNSDGAALVAYKHGGSTGSFSAGAIARTTDEKFDEQWASTSDFGDVTASESAANTAFNAAVTAISSDGIIFNPVGSLVNFDTVTVPNGVLVIDAEGQRLIASNVGIGKSVQGGGGHLLIRNVNDETAGRLHIEPSNWMEGTTGKLDIMFDPYEDDGVNYRIVNLYAKSNQAADTSTQQGNNGIAVLGVKSTGDTFGVWPSLHFGFSDDGAGGAVPMKMYYFDTSDSTWRTPMLGAWRQGIAVTTGDYILASNKLYQATTDGTTGATKPTHSSSTASDGGVTWSFVRDFAAASNSIKGCIVFGDRDDLPKFGHATVRVQLAQEMAVWNDTKIQFLDASDAVSWNIYSPLNSDDLYIENAAATGRMRFDETGEFIQITGLALAFGADTASDGDTTPSITGVRTLVFNNTGSTSVTQFDDGIPYQEFIVRAGNGNTTLVHGTNLRLVGGGNITLTTDDAIMFQMGGSGTVATMIRG